jgi:hypothetical protein
MADSERVIPISSDDLTRIFADDEAVTFNFNHAASVTLVYEKNRQKWAEHNRPQDVGDVFFLSDEDEHHITHSRLGLELSQDVRIIREGSANPDTYTTGTERSGGG